MRLYMRLYQRLNPAFHGHSFPSSQTWLPNESTACCKSLFCSMCFCRSSWRHMERLDRSFVCMKYPTLPKQFTNGDLGEPKNLPQNPPRYWVRYCSLTPLQRAVAVKPPYVSEHPRNKGTCWWRQLYTVVGCGWLLWRCFWPRTCTMVKLWKLWHWSNHGIWQVPAPIMSSVSCW